MENKESKPDKKTDVLKIAISAITIITPLIYLIGLNFYAGILSGYGVSNSLFPFSIEENLTAAYYFLFNIMFNPNHQEKFLLIIIVAIVITIFIALALLFLELLLKKSYVLIKDQFKIDGYDKNKEFNRLRKDNFFDVKAINIVLLIILMPILPVIANIIGTDFSKKRIEGFSENKCMPKNEEVGWGKCVTVVDNKNNQTIAKGLLIAASENRIAIYSDNKSRILNYSNNYELFYEYENETKKQ